jgi:hypothetical protein
MDSYFVELASQAINPAYIFKIRDFKALGTGILVKSNSPILNYLTVGDVIDLKYQQIDNPKEAKYIKTEIKQITKYDEGKYHGHHIVCLSTFE